MRYESVLRWQPRPRPWLSSLLQLVVAGTAPASCHSFRRFFVSSEVYMCIYVHQSVPYFATIRSVHCRWAAQESLSMQCTGAAHGSRRVRVGYGYQLVALNITSWCVQYKFRLRLLACLFACLLACLLACVYARSLARLHACLLACMLSCMRLQCQHYRPLICL